MRRVLAIAAIVVTPGLFLALPAGPASADGYGGSGDGQGSYVVGVSVTGSGAGSGGSLAGPPVSGGRVSVPSPCGYQSNATQQEIEAAYGGDKQRAQEYLNQTKSVSSDSPVSIPWGQGVIDNWGKQGTWYLPGCDPGSGMFDKFTAENKPVLVGPGAAAGPPVPQVDPKFLEDIAIRAMTLPQPGIGYNPKDSAGGQTFPRIPGGTWVWVTPEMAAGATRDVTASAGGISATVVATFDGATFTSSGGTTTGSVSCPDGGKAYKQGTVSSCVLEYVTSSGSGSYTVTAEAVWSATVSSPAGSRAIEGARMTGQIALKVGEIQTANR